MSFTSFIFHPTFCHSCTQSTKHLGSIKNKKPAPSNLFGSTLKTMLPTFSPNLYLFLYLTNIHSHLCMAIMVIILNLHHTQNVMHNVKRKLTNNLFLPPSSLLPNDDSPHIFLLFQVFEVLNHPAPRNNFKFSHHTKI